jgi:excinuclease ABC subunit A
MTATEITPTTSRTAAPQLIRIRGARVHNLQQVDVDLPRRQFVVITGVSGSGKSSLAFDTLFAEGQRRYLETLSSQTRTYFDQIPSADVDEIDGLPPTLSVEQHVGALHPRATLATTTGIHEFLRLLYARCGMAHCPQCDRELTPQTSQAVVDTILALEAGRKAMILAPLVRGKKGQHKELFEKICRDGFVRARVNGEIIDASSPPELKKTKAHHIDVVVDRIVVKDGLRARLQESVESALRHGNGSCIICHETAGEAGAPLWQERLYSTRFACPDCQLSFAEIEPRTFSFNSPYGACPTCEGMGLVAEPAEQLCPDCHGARLAPLGRRVTVAGRPIHDFLAASIPSALSWIEQLTTRQVRETFAAQQQRVLERLLPEIQTRLQFLQQVGVEYLTLDRPTTSLSGGEFQRARIAGCLGGGLIGVCYVLDEPTIGLHPRDTGRLLDSLLALRDKGNSVIVVEHDLDVISRADYVVDLGPGAGREGGRLIAAGTPRVLAEHPQSLTARYLRRQFSPSAPADTRERVAATLHDPAISHPGNRAAGPPLILSGATARNLKNITVEFPLGAITCVTGVSGSGKSSLVMESLVPKLRALLARRELRAGAAADVEDTLPGHLAGAEPIDRLIEVDQSPLGRNARSNPATASGMWDEIRKLFARTRDARVRGFRASRFSFNAAGGRCEDCHGQGTRRISLQFLPDLEVTCPVCRGARFNRQTLQVLFRGKSVADILNMRIDEAAAFFENFAHLQQWLSTFVEVGLGYLALGQSATTLSGGEAQRIKLASELGRRTQGRTLYVLDEPTTGLHPADIERLLELLKRLTAAGHTVIVVEHQLEMISQADWLIDLGPEGGQQQGGHLVASGPPSLVATHQQSHTGRALARFWGIP